MQPSTFWNCLLIAGLLLSLVGLSFPFSMAAPVEEAPGLEADKLRRRPDGRCLVCRDPLTADRVECRSCRTPHHRDCWDYVGSCSIYGCGTRSWTSGS